MTSYPAESPAYDIIATSQDRRREVRERHHNGLDIVEAHENRRGWLFDVPRTDTSASRSGQHPRRRPR